MRRITLLYYWPNPRNNQRKGANRIKSPRNPGNVRDAQIRSVKELVIRLRDVGPREAGLKVKDRPSRPMANQHRRATKRTPKWMLIGHRATWTVLDLQPCLPRP